jgi:hypothetical protein
MGKSVAYYGLRTNASQLLAGAGVNAVRRRIKLDALLHDEVLLEGGVFTLTAGPSLVNPIYKPDWPDDTKPRWQTASDRHPRGVFQIRESSAMEGLLLDPDALEDIANETGIPLEYRCRPGFGGTRVSQSHHRRATAAMDVHAHATGARTSAPLPLAPMGLGK